VRWIHLITTKSVDGSSEHCNEPSLSS